MRQPRFIVGIALSGLLALSGCAASQASIGERSSLSPKREQVVPKEELRGTCPGLTMNLNVYVDRMKALQAKAKTGTSGPPTTIAGLLQGQGSEAAEEMARERRRADAINAALGEKGCKTVDIAAALRTP